MICGITISEYIRKRKLSNAGYDLYSNNLRVIDVAQKYGYDNATSFSRAFEKFHGIKPSKVNKTTKLKNYPRIIFNEEVVKTKEQSYEIVSKEAMILYGVGIDVNEKNITSKAPKFFLKTKKQYGEIVYGMTTYCDTERIRPLKYYCLFENNTSGLEKIEIIPVSTSIILLIRDVISIISKFLLVFNFKE